MRIEPEISGVHVILLGDFNPAIFTPSWFALHGLLPERVADTANLRIASQHVTEFAADWLRLQVTAEQFFAETLLAPHVRLCDLIARTFKEYLHHTPVSALGINRDVHFRVPDFSERDRIGRTLAPTEPWGTWGRDLGPDGRSGGMTSLTMRQVNPEGRPTGGQINVTVEPSNRIGEGRTGVYVRVNDHYAIDNAELRTAERLMELLEVNFDSSLERSNGIIDHIMSLATNPKES